MPTTRRSESMSKAGLTEIICNKHILHLNLLLKPGKLLLRINDAKSKLHMAFPRAGPAKLKYLGYFI